MKEVHQDLRDEMQKDLEQKCNEYRNERIKITTMVVLGDVADKIIECSNNEKIDLLVIGSVGLKGISGFFKRLGSVSRSVSERVTCPIMIVR